MDEEKYQKELFEFKKPRRFFPRLSDLFPRGDFERNVILTLTLDKAVFIAIGIIMIMVVVYALGVETGKTKVLENPQPASPAVVSAAPQIKAVVMPNIAVAVQPVNARPQLGAKPQQVPQGAVTPAIQTGAANNFGKPYTIVAVTLTRKETALQEIAKLKKLGFDARLVQSDRYFQVCVGAYPDKTSTVSLKDLTKVKRMYKDAYLKMH